MTKSVFTKVEKFFLFSYYYSFIESKPIGRPRTRSIRLKDIFKCEDNFEDNKRRFKPSFSDRVLNYPYHDDIKPKEGIMFPIIDALFTLLPGHFKSFSDTLELIQDPTRGHNLKLPVAMLLRRTRFTFTSSL